MGTLRGQSIEHINVSNLQLRSFIILTIVFYNLTKISRRTLPDWRYYHPIC